METVAEIPTKPPWNVKAIWLAPETTVGNVRCIEEGSVCAVQGVSLSGFKMCFLLDEEPGELSLAISRSFG